MTDQRKHWAQSTGDPEPGAPSGVLPISVDALNHLGVDGEGNLYWIDTKILTAKKEFRLSWFQATLATITALAALIAAIAASVSAYADLRTPSSSMGQPNNTTMAGKGSTK